MAVDFHLQKTCLFLPLVYLIFAVVHEVQGSHSSFCVRFPTLPTSQRSSDVISLGADTYFQKDVYQDWHDGGPAGAGAVGAEVFDTDNVNLNKDDPLFIEVSAIYPGDKWLKGWLQVVVNFNGFNTIDFNDYIFHALTVVAEDDYGRAVGEFVHSDNLKFAKRCETRLSDDYRKDILEQYIPCRGIGPREPLHPGVYHFSNEMNSDTGNADIPWFNPKHGIPKFVTHWRFSQYYCNLVDKIRFKGRMIFKHKVTGAFLHRKATFFWLHLKDWLASDPVSHYEDEGRCTLQIFRIHRPSDLVRFVLKRGPLESETDTMRLPCGQLQDNGKGAYAGRCSLDEENRWVNLDKTAAAGSSGKTEMHLIKADVNQDLQCQPRENAWGLDRFSSYDDYVHGLRNQRLPLSSTAGTVSSDGCCIIIPPMTGSTGAGSRRRLSSRKGGAPTTKPKKKNGPLTDEEMAEEVRIGLNSAFPFAENIWVFEFATEGSF